jgi:hypothetical protein
MHRIRNTETQETTVVSQQPEFSNGVWDCGDRRFLDPDGLLYEIVPEPITRVAFKSLFTIQEQVAIKKARAYSGADESKISLKYLLDAAYDILDDTQLETMDLAAPVVVQFLAALKEAGILTPEREAMIANGVEA